MRKYITQLTIICVLLSIVGCGRKWDNPVESAVPLPGVPGLISPANNAWIWNAQDTITFKWSKVDGATKYKLLLSNYSTISDSFVAIEIADTFYNWLDTNKLGKMYWQVSAWNPINEWKPSLINTFEKGPYLIGKTFTTYYGATPTSQIIYNNYFYLFYYQDIAIYDISDYNNPIHIKNVIIPNNRLHHKAILKNNLIYLGMTANNGSDGLSIISLSDPLNPLEIGYVITDANIDNAMNLGIDIKDTIAYVVNSEKGLYIINITTPSNIFNITTCYVGKPASEISINGNYAYIAKNDSGISIVNISDPSIPYIENNLYLSRTISDVYAYNNLLYAPGYKFSIVNPLNPTVLADNENFYYSSGKIFVNGGFIFVGYRAYQDINNIMFVGDCKRVNNDTLASVWCFDIAGNCLFSHVTYYKYINSARYDLGSGVCVFKVAPFSVTK